MSLNTLLNVKCIAHTRCSKFSLISTVRDLNVSIVLGGEKDGYGGGGK